jgi:hypothetical protein
MRVIHLIQENRENIQYGNGRLKARFADGVPVVYLDNSQNPLCADCGYRSLQDKDILYKTYGFYFRWAHDKTEVHCSSCLKKL